MKTKLLGCTLVVLSAIMMGCGSMGEEPKKGSVPFRVLANANSPYAPLLDSSREMFWVYSFTDMHMFNDSALQKSRFFNADANTYMIDEQHNRSLIVRDSCEITRLSDVNVFTMKRSISLNPFAMSTELRSTFQMDNFEPISFISPYSTECDPMPFCYFKDMEITWNGAADNENGVIIIAEWCGSNAYYEVTDRSSIITVDVVEDDGVAVLDNDMFEGMPHGALVNLWIMRANLAEPQMSQDTEALNAFIHAIEINSELGSSFSDKTKHVINSMENPLVVNASIALLPIILIKELPEE